MGGTRVNSDCHSVLTFFGNASKKIACSKLSAARASFLPKADFSMATTFVTGCNVHGFAKMTTLTLMSGTKGIGRFVSGRCAFSGLRTVGDGKDVSNSKVKLHYVVARAPRPNSQV